MFYFLILRKIDVGMKKHCKESDFCYHTIVHNWTLNSFSLYSHFNPVIRSHTRLFTRPTFYAVKKMRFYSIYFIKIRQKNHQELQLKLMEQNHQPLTVCVLKWSIVFWNIVSYTLMCLNPYHSKKNIKPHPGHARA